MKADMQGNRAAEDPDHRSQRNPGQGVVVPLKPVQQSDQKRNRESPPHHPAAEQGSHLSRARLAHLQRHLHDGKREALVLFPLLSHQDRQADENDVQHHQERPPTPHGNHPRQPWHRVAGGKTVVQPRYRLRIQNRQPRKGIGQHRFQVSHFRRGIVGYARHKAQQGFGHFP